MSKIENLNENILIWYPFKKDSEILYLTEKGQDIKLYFPKESKNITVVQFRKNDIETQISSDEKIKKIEGNFDKISINEKYDYVIMLGTMEYAKEIIKEDKPYIKLLEFAKTKLKEDGTILLAIDNRMGVKYLVGNKSEHCKNIYDSIDNKFEYGNMFSKKEITEIIDSCNFVYKKYYYPLPDYKHTNVIYTDELLPKRSDSKINYNIVYNEKSLIVQNENALLKQFIKEDNFREYTNSYLIELSNYKIENGIKYVSYNNMRKDKYSLILKIFENKVEKQIKNTEAKQHLQNIKNNVQKLKKLGFELAEEELQENENQIVEKMVEYPQLDNYIVDAIKKHEVERSFDAIDGWYNYIKQRINLDENGYIEDGFIDLVFENVFYDDVNKNYIFFDQEWYVPNVKMEFILYRAINNLYKHNKSLNNYYPIEKMNEHYNINGSEEFENIEKELQEEVIDEEKRQFYAEQYEYIISSEEIQKNIEDLKRFDRDNQQLLKEIEKLRKQINEKDNMINSLEIKEEKDNSFWGLIKTKYKK